MTRNGLGWRGQSGAVRACRGPGCPSTGTTTVDVAAIGDAHRIDLRNLPVNGVVVARLVNQGAGEEEVYRLGRGADTTYYLVVERAPGPVDPARPHAVQTLVAITTGGGPPSIVVRPLAGMFRACPPVGTHPGPVPAYAKFTGCAGAAAEHGAESAAQASDTAAAMIARRLRELAWISCIHGCCEMEA